LANTLLPSTLVFFFSGCLAYRLYRSINDGDILIGWLLLLPAFPMFWLERVGTNVHNQSTPILLFTVY